MPHQPNSARLQQSKPDIGVFRLLHTLNAKEC